MMAEKPFFSIIIPVYNGAGHLADVIESIENDDGVTKEIIVVDDCSNDGSNEIARGLGATVLRTTKQSGPATARNLGASKSSGRYLLFLDSDCQPNANSFVIAQKFLLENPEISAIFGSYDTRSPERNWTSMYKNLTHHYVHQNAKNVAKTFWTGFGAISPEAFNRVGGFDENDHEIPSMEDIHLGYKLIETGYEIRLVKSAQVTHLKRWSLLNSIHADLFQRAIPWTRLLLKNRSRITNDLTLGYKHRVSVVLVYLAILLVVLSAGLSIFGIATGAWLPINYLCLLIILLALFILHLDYFRFMSELRGFSFAVFCYLMNLVFYFDCGLGAILGFFLHLVETIPKKVSKV